MMKPFITFDETGTYVEGVGWAKYLPEGAEWSDPSVPPETFIGCLRDENGNLVPRLEAPRPVALDPEGFTISEVQPGTTVQVFDTISSETMLDMLVPEGDPVDIAFVLRDEGSYLVTVEPLMPTQATKTYIEVDHVGIATIVGELEQAVDGLPDAGLEPVEEVG